MSERHGLLPKRLRNPVRKALEDKKYHQRILPTRKGDKRIQKLRPQDIFDED